MHTGMDWTGQDRTGLDGIESMHHCTYILRARKGGFYIASVGVWKEESSWLAVSDRHDVTGYDIS